MIKNWKDLDEVETQLKQVPCDDYGDRYYRYYVEWYHEGKLLYSDYYHTKPDEVILHNTLVEAIKNDAVGGVCLR